jgi:glycosyltransferase involved in cell wall biosynthesis
MKFSIVLVSHHNVVYLKRCLDSLYACYLNKEFPLIIMVEKNDETTTSFLDQYKQRAGLDQLEYHEIQSENYTLAEARNQALALVQTPYVGFLCDFTEAPEHYLTKVVHIINQENPDAFGGPDLTHPESSYLERTIGALQTSQLAKGNHSIRHGFKHKMKAKTLPAKEYGLNFCNFWFKMELYKKYKFCFDQRLKKNEVRVLAHKLIAARKKVYFIEDFYVYNRRSSSFFDYLKQTFLSSRYTFYSFTLYPKSFDFFYFAPSALFVYLLLLPLLIKSQFLYIAYFYSIMLIYYSLKVSVQSKNIWNFPVHIVMHLMTNIFSALGTFSVLFKKPSTHAKSALPTS